MCLLTGIRRFFRNQKVRIITLLAGLFCISNQGFSQYRLEIEISGFRNDNGILMLQLFDAKQKIIGQEKARIEGEKSNISFSGLQTGKYGVRYFHDEDLSGKMETNLVGKPIEGYGFSNNAIGTFGPPKFEKWLFELSGDKKINLRITY